MVAERANGGGGGAEYTVHRKGIQSAYLCLDPSVSCFASWPSQVWRESTAQLREAADLFRRAADSGNSDASYQLGRLYQQGLGLPLDPVAAFDNFVAAADGEVFHPAAGEEEGS